MALIPELKEYIDKGSPEAKSVLTKAANKMPEAQQREFLASLQLGGAEFQLAVAPYMPKGSTIDPSRARLKAFPKGAGVPASGLNMKGASTGKIKDPENPNLKVGPFRGYDIMLEPETVSAIEAINATPRVFAHEYRHFEDTDGVEIVNRIQDLMASQNRDDLRKSARMLADRALVRTSRDTGKGKGKGKGKYGEGKDSKKLYTDLYNATINSSEEEVIEAAKALMRSPEIVKLMDFGGGNTSLTDLFPDIRKKGALGSYFKRYVLEDTDATEMPKDFRAGGRTRLI
jgi:hypothetical protein